MNFYYSINLSSNQFKYKKINLKKLKLNKNVISDLEQRTIKGGTIGGCHSHLGTCGPPESLDAYPADCPFG